MYFTAEIPPSPLRRSKPQFQLENDMRLNKSINDARCAVRFKIPGYVIVAQRVVVGGNIRVVVMRYLIFKHLYSHLCVEDILHL